MTSNSSTNGKTSPENKSSTNKPEATFRFGNISAAVFRVETKHGSMLSVSLDRSYKDAAGDWHHTNTLTHSDLLPAAFALTKCFEYIASAKD